MQLELFEIDKGQHGATWWAGAWQCRNWHGWLQSRENGVGRWCFLIYGFGTDTCSVHVIGEDGQGTLATVPIDASDRITIMGRLYGRSRWMH